MLRVHLLPISSFLVWSSSWYLTTSRPINCEHHYFSSSFFCFLYSLQHPVFTHL
jgi:hypothetical protein